MGRVQSPEASPERFRTADLAINLTANNDGSKVTYPANASWLVLPVAQTPAECGVKAPAQTGQKGAAYLGVAKTKAEHRGHFEVSMGASSQRTCSCGSGGAWPSPALRVFLTCRPLHPFSHAPLGDLAHRGVRGEGRGRGLLYQRLFQRLDLLAQRIRAATLDFLLRWPAFPAASATFGDIYGTHEEARRFSTSCAGE